MSFIPRSTFPYPLRTPSWFAGHMSRSLRELPSLLQDIDLVIEARDARLPLTSINPTFDNFLNQAKRKGKGKGKEREKLVVYTKRDLAEERFELPLQNAFLKHAKQKIMFADTRVDQDVRQVLHHAVRLATDNSETMPDMRILVVGMPNVGKSSLLNALRRVGLRKGKAFRTGAEAGITRKLTGTVKIYDEPSVYVYDTPGVMMPFLGRGEAGAERGLKLALTAGIKESLFEQDAMVDYLLWRMNCRLVFEQDQGLGESSRHETYLDLLPLPPSFTEPTDSLPIFLDAIADRLGALKKGGERDHETAMLAVIRAFREGRLGRWTLDELIPPASRQYEKESAIQDGSDESTSTIATPLSSSATTTTPPIHNDQESKSNLENAVSLTVQQFLSNSASNSNDTDSPSAQTQSLNQKRKADKRQRLLEHDEKLRAKGINVKKREAKPGLFDGLSKFGTRTSLSKGSRTGEAGKISRARRARLG